MKQVFIYGGVVILVLIIVGVYYNRENLIKDNSLESRCMQQNMHINKKYNNTLCKNVKLLNVNSDTVNLRGLFKKNKSIFLLFFDEFNCNLCNESALNLLNYYNAKIASSNVYVICKFNNLRSFLVFKSMNKSKLEIFVTSEVFHASLDSLNAPYFCEVNESLKIRNIFFPEKKLPQITNNYLSYTIGRINE